MPHPRWYKDKTEKQREYRKRRKAREKAKRELEYKQIKEKYYKELSLSAPNETVVALENISKFLREQNSNNTVDKSKARDLMSEEELIVDSESIMEYWTCSHCGSSVPIYYEYCHNCYDLFRRLESRPYDRDSDAEIFLITHSEFKKYIRDRNKPIVSEDMI